MNPTPAPNSNDETAMSLPAGEPFTAAGEATDAGTPTDATVVRAAPSSPTINEKPDTSSFGKYELLGEIARGGMGVVYRARQPGLDRTVALKMILGTGINHETAVRFLQEARAAAALDHPNVVPIYDIGEIGDRPYFTMALIDGPNLRGHLDAIGVAPIPVVVALFAQIVAGVAHAHQNGIIHRDLKPANVLIDKDGRPRVTDFGLAKRAATDSQLTVTGQVVGTPQYMAPEQARDSKDVGPPADVYALGAILYFLLTGKPPFQGESFTDLLIKVVSETPVPPSELRPDVPVELEALCLRCLAKAPGERFADADALGAALAPLADQYLAPSATFAPSLARIGLSRPSTPAVGTVPDLTPTLNSGPAFANAASAVGAAPPVPNRRPLVFGLVAVAVLLVGAIGYLATRDSKKYEVEVTKQAPPAPAQPNPAPVAPAVVNPVTPNPVPAGKVAWAPPTRADFGIRVEPIAEKKDAAGTFQLTAGKKMNLRLTAEKDCRVFVWLVEPNGDVTQLFPNDHEQDNTVIAGKERIVPGNDRYDLETTATEGAGTDRLRVLAIAGTPPALPVGKRMGKLPFPVYTGTDGERLASAVADITTRGVVIKPSGMGTAPAPMPGTTPQGAVAEAEVRFRVQK